MYGRNTFILFFLLLPGAARSSLSLNEIMASNVTAHAGPRGQYEDWIEIHNRGEAEVDLAGYFIVDDWPDKALWQIPAGQAHRTTVPAGGYRLLYADGEPEAGADHLPFRLSKDGEQVVLIAADGTSLVDSLSFPQQLRDVSYGRPSNDISRGYMPEPTPGAANSRGFSTFVRPPAIAPASGMFDDAAAVSAQPADSGDQVRYTLDGSDPTASSPLYSGPVSITRTVVFKARSFAAGALPSTVVARIFLVGAEHALPVMAVLTDPANLHDPERGILVNDRPGRAWERFVELAFFEEGGLGFQVPAGLRLQGNTGPREYRKKSFRAYFRGGYGADDLEYPLHPGDWVTRFNRLVLRSGYDDSLEPTERFTNRGGTLLHDPLASELWSRTGGLTPRSRFAVLYLNAEFTGIYDLKQNVDEDFVQDHLGYEAIDLVRTRWDSTELVHGDKDKWDAMLRFFADHSLVDDDLLASASCYLDLDNFIDLQALVHAIHYRNWAYGVYAFREKDPDRPWQWTIWDADRTFDNADWNGFTTLFNPLNRELDRLLTKRLLANQSFRTRFINRFADLFNTTFSGPQVQVLIDSLAQTIAAEIPAEVERWDSSVATWERNVGLMEDFVHRRPVVVRRQMEEFFELDGQALLTVEVEGPGEVQVNTVVPSAYPWSGTYFLQVPLPLQARPAPGHRFAGWSDPQLPDQPAITLTPAADLKVKALFLPAVAAGISAELVAPQSVPAGRQFPYVVRLRGPDGGIEPTEQSPMQVRFSGVRADTAIAIKRGAGTGVGLMAERGFVLEVGNEAVASASRDIAVSARPVKVHAGRLPVGEVVWDAGADHLVTGDITVPDNTHLILEAGAWVAVGARVNFFVRGRVSARGTAAAPVVLTSADWPEPWGGMEFTGAEADFRYCMVLNGGGDHTRGMWHTGRQHIFFGKLNSTFEFDQCFFLNSPGKVFGCSNSVASISNSVSSFVHHGGEFVLTLLSYRDSHFMNLPNDDGIYEEDIDTDGLHVDYVNARFPRYSVIDNCYFVTGKDDGIDHHGARLQVSNCWIEDFAHEGIAASGGDTLRIFNTVALNNDQGFEAGYTEYEYDDGPHVFIDHSVAVGNNVGLRIGDDYNWDGWTYRDKMTVTNSVLYGNGDNVLNFVHLIDGPLEGALDISHSLTNDPEFDGRDGNIAGIPRFDARYFLLPDSPGFSAGVGGVPLGRADSTVIVAANSVLEPAAGPGLPCRFVLEQNYPNPFNPSTRIEYILPRAGRVSLSVFNLLGQRVADLHENTPQGAGFHRFVLNASHWPGGVYFYRLRLDHGSHRRLQQTRKMVLVK